MNVFHYSKLRIVNFLLIFRAYETQINEK